MPKHKTSIKKKKPKAKKKASKKTFIKPVEAPNIDYTERYKCHENYKLLCARTHAGSYGKCCVCLTSKGVEIHHSRYLGVKDTIGKNIFSCCVRCDNLYCHNSTVWVRSKTDHFGATTTLLSLRSDCKVGTKPSMSNAFLQELPRLVLLEQTSLKPILVERCN